MACARSLQTEKEAPLRFDWGLTLHRFKQLHVTGYIPERSDDMTWTALPMKSAGVSGLGVPCAREYYSILEHIAGGIMDKVNWAICRKAVPLILLLGTTSCANQSFETFNLPPGQIATLLPYDSSGPTQPTAYGPFPVTDVTVKALDGVDHEHIGVRTEEPQIQLLPGHHTITFTPCTGGYTCWGVQTIPFEVLAGHHYEFRFSMGALNIRAWIVETETGKTFH